MNPHISVLTPTWNRESYLSKVWEGLVAQNYCDFEWIVANDGSTDNTIEVVRELAAKSDFPVSLINASCRIGKSRMDNEAVAIARGDFIIWCDSDDYLLPGCLDTLVNTWNSIPLEQREEYCGVTALCRTESGVLGNQFYQPETCIDIIATELHRKVKSDLVIFTRSDLVKENPFLEVDFLIPESSVWNVIGTRKTRFLSMVLKRVSYREVNCISYSGHMSYNRGNAHALALAKNLAPHIQSKAAQWLSAINYLRYCRHGEINFREAMALWRVGPMDLLKFIAVLPVSELLSMKDRLQGKVRRTHRDFLEARNHVKIEISRLNS